MKAGRDRYHRLIDHFVSHDAMNWSPCGASSSVSDQAVSSDLPLEPLTGLRVSPCVLAILSIPVSAAALVIWDLMGGAAIGSLATLFGLGAPDFRTVIFSFSFAVLGALAVSRNWNRALEKIHETESRLREVELRDLEHRRLIALGRLAAGLAHEIRNPLVIISASLDMLRTEVPPPLEGHLDRINSGASRIDAVVSRMVGLARAARDGIVEVEAVSILDRAVSPLQADAESAGITIETGVSPEHLRIRAAEGVIELILSILIGNAMDAVRQPAPDSAGRARAGRIRVSVTADNDVTRIEVEDNGLGVPFEDRARIFDPFFTTKEIGRGSGLGLSMIHGYVAEIGGKIEVGESRWKGARFLVSIPTPPEA